MSSILFVGELAPGTRAARRMQAMRELGHQVSGVHLRPSSSAGTGIRGLLTGRLRRGLAAMRERDRSNERLRARLRKADFHALWIDGELDLQPATLDLARALQPDLALVAFLERDADRGARPSRDWIACLERFDLMVTADGRGAFPMHETAPCWPQPWAFDPSQHFPHELGADDRARLGSEVSYLGPYGAHAAEHCSALAEAGIEVRVFGESWQRRRERHRGLRVSPPLGSAEERARAVRAASIQLCTRPSNREGLQDRLSTEIAACGGFLLAERTPELEALFAEGAEAAYFDGARDLVELARRYLASPAEREALARAGRRRATTSDYSHHGVCARVLARLGVPSPVAPDAAAAAAERRSRGFDLEAPAAPVHRINRERIARGVAG
jgi:spore maturation protein CgeB